MAFLSDLFTGTNGTNLEAHTADSGATWTVHPSHTASAKIQTNRIYGNAALRFYYASATPVTADYDVEGIIRAVTLATSGGVCGRMSDSADTTYYAQLAGAAATVGLTSRVAGVETSLGTYASGKGVGSDTTLRLVMRGSSIKVLVDGVERISATDSSITAAGRAGIKQGASATTTGYHLDSIAGTDTHTATASVAGDGSVSATGTRKALGAAAISGTGAVAAAGVRSTLAVAALFGTGTIAAAGVRKALGQASIVGTGGVNATGGVTRIGAAALSGTGSLSATGARTAVVTAALAGTGTLAADATRTALVAVGIAGAGTISATVLVVYDVWPQDDGEAWNQDTDDLWQHTDEEAWAGV